MLQSPLTVMPVLLQLQYYPPASPPYLCISHAGIACTAPVHADAKLSSLHGQNCSMPTGISLLALKSRPLSAFAFLVRHFRLIRHPGSHQLSLPMSSLLVLSHNPPPYSVCSPIHPVLYHNIASPPPSLNSSSSSPPISMPPSPRKSPQDPVYLYLFSSSQPCRDLLIP